MTITKLFESLDEKVFTPELKESLQTQFDEAVETLAEAKAQIIADEKIEEAIDNLETKSREYTEMLESKAEQYAEYVREETLTKVSEYLDVVVQEFVTEAELALSESARSEKADMMIEAFDSMLKATGTDFANIAESREPQDNSEIVESANARIDTLMNEMRVLKAENEELVKLGLIQELSEGLTIMESAKFKRLSEMVEFTRDDSYMKKLQTIQESVIGFSPKEEPLNEEAKKSETPTGPIWSHLV